MFASVGGVLFALVIFFAGVTLGFFIRTPSECEMKKSELRSRMAVGADERRIKTLLKNGADFNDIVAAGGDAVDAAHYLR